MNITKKNHFKLITELDLVPINKQLKPSKMSKFELKEGQGTIFKNEKQKENQPDYTGTVKVNGEEKRIALWVKDGKKGKYFSAQISEKQEVKGYPSKEYSKKTDDLPF